MLFALKETNGANEHEFIEMEAIKASPNTDDYLRSSKDDVNSRLKNGSTRSVKPKASFTARSLLTQTYCAKYLNLLYGILS